MWVAVRADDEIRTASVSDNTFNTTNLFDRFRWAQAVSDVAYSVFLFAAVAYVTLWPRRRDGGNG